MTPTRFDIAKHLTATLFAVTLVGLLVLGVDGMLGAMQKLTRLVTAAPPAAAVPAVVPAFVVPADEGASAQPQNDRVPSER